MTTFGLLDRRGAAMAILRNSLSLSVFVSLFLCSPSHTLSHTLSSVSLSIYLSLSLSLYIYTYTCICLSLCLSFLSLARTHMHQGLEAPKRIGDEARDGLQPQCSEVLNLLAVTVTSTFQLLGFL